MNLDLIAHIAEVLLICVGFVLGRTKLQEIHLTLNSRLDALILASEQVGAERERVAQHARAAQQALGVASTKEPSP